MHPSNVSIKTPFNPAWIVSGVYIFEFTSITVSAKFQEMKDVGLPTLFKTSLKLCILTLLGMLSLKINTFSCFFFCYCVTVRFITCEYWYFVKYRLIFWIGINYDRRCLFRNVFCWKLLTILLKPKWKSLLSM